VSGTAGVGKTALAVHWAQRVAGRFPDGQLYVNLRGYDPSGSVLDPTEALRGFLDALGVPPDRIPAGQDARASRYRSLLAGRRILLVLDNARDADQVRPLLPGAPGCLAVVTSRRSLTGLVAAEGARPLVLDLLTTAEARDLLAHRIGATRAAAEPAAVAQLLGRCAGLPLALAIVAARTATQPRVPLATLAAELANTSGRLDAFAGDDAATDIRTVFFWSYRTLGPAAARLFRLLGLHPGPDLATPAAASLAGVPPGEAQALLAELVHAHLVTEHRPGRYSLHDLLRVYAGELVVAEEPADERHAATHRLLDHYLHTALAAAGLHQPNREPIALALREPVVPVEDFAAAEQALAWLAAERPVLLATIRLAADAGFDTHAWQLAWTLSAFLNLQGHWHDWLASHHGALAAAERLGHLPAQAYAHRMLARCRVQLGDYDPAAVHYRHALDLFCELGDAVGQAHVHLSFSWMLDLQGRPQDALDHDRRGLELYRAAGHQLGQARALNMIGWDHARLGSYRQALGYCRQALELQQQIGDRYGEAATWDSLGYTHHHLGDHDQAVSCYEQALERYREAGDRTNEAEILTHLGETRHAAGDGDGARAAWEDALAILDDLDHPDAGAIQAKLDLLGRPEPVGCVSAGLGR
jgi:tetratricopeptide (TPR) repeat protein